MHHMMMFRICVFFLLGLWLAVGLAPPLSADSHGPLDASLASDLLQARAQLRIYRYDDRLDLDCQARAFTDADVVTQPRVVDRALGERKWVETWRLDRCGAEIAYHVYFTEVGDGGAYFTFLEAEWQTAPASGPVNGVAAQAAE